ncbi:hypothetical protein Tco_0267738 [Tanacetum coccineum]
MSSSSSTSYRRYNRNQDVTHKTHCECDPPHPIPVQVTWTLENPDPLNPNSQKKQLIIKMAKGKEIICLSSDSSTDEVPKEGTSIARVPKEGPSLVKGAKEGPLQALLDWYGYDTYEEYLEDTFFDSTYKDTTNKDSTDKNITGEDTMDECYSSKSKGICTSFKETKSKKSVSKALFQSKDVCLD